MVLCVCSLLFSGGEIDCFQVHNFCSDNKFEMSNCFNPSCVGYKGGLYYGVIWGYEKPV